jgi:putative tryptophan/tyrosine transport system substrate-binding protein
MGGKWVETLKAILPTLSNVMVILNPETAPYFAQYSQSIEIAAASFGVKLSTNPVRDAADLERAISSLAHDPNAGLVVFPSTFMQANRMAIFESTARHFVPAIYSFSYYAKDGGLISYGFDAQDIFLRAASYVDRILKTPPCFRSNSRQSSSS